MDLARARPVFAAIEAARPSDLKSAIFAAANRYAGLRAEYTLASPASRADLEGSRTRAHDAFIDACNILSRDMASAGEDNSWRAVAGNDRRELGDLACFIQLFLGLKAR